MIWTKLRSRLDEISTLLAILSMLTFIAIGITVTILTTENSNWINWHFSYLGEGGSVSAKIFNLTLIISSSFLFIASYTMRRELYLIKESADKFHRIWPNFFCINLIFMGLSLILVALTPRDLYPAIHDIFGHDIYYSVIVMSLLAPIFLPGYSISFYIYSYTQHLLFLLFEYLYRTDVLTNLFPMQITIFLVSCLWIVVATWPARKLNMQARTIVTRPL